MKKSSRALWVICIYSLLELFTDILGSTPWGIERRFEIFGIFQIVEYAMFAYFFYLSIQGALARKLLVIISVLVLLALIFAFTKSKKEGFDSITASVVSIAIIVLSLIYFYEQISKPQNTYIYSSPNFWIVIALMVYMSSTLFLFIISNNLSVNEMKKYWAINNISSLVSNIIFCIAFLVSRFGSKNPIFENPYEDVLKKP
ncbi:MAG: hypothetical protein JST75_15320 [Bacteroidetes bacterium]|nr:hypothetical protein [Bacteroidota bacterium]